MTFRPAAAAAGFAAALLLAAPFAARAACTMKTTTVPVEMQGMRPMVTAKINGQPVKLLVDSGAFYNGLDAKFAAEQKLRPVGVEALGSHFTSAAKVNTSGIGGADLSSTLVKVPEFEFVGAKFNNVPFLTLNLGRVSGNLGQNFLHLMDNEYDLKNGVMRLARPEGCGSSALAYWGAPGAAFSALALDSTSEGAESHTMATITINGVNMRALFDTGSTTTFITERAAARAGVKTSDPGVTPGGLSIGIDRTDIKTWLGRFASVKIGDEEIKNGLLRIGETDAKYFDILIGADFFMAHHVYVANSQNQIYFTYNGGPVFNVRSSAAAAQSPGAPAPR